MKLYSQDGPKGYSLANANHSRKKKEIKVEKKLYCLIMAVLESFQGKTLYHPKTSVQIISGKNLNKRRITKRTFLSHL